MAKNKPKKKKTLKQWIGKIHLWLGLSSGLIVFIVSITGCIFCFHDEIKDLTRDWRKVEAVNAPYLMPSVLQAKTKALYPNATADMVVYNGSDRSALVYSTEAGEAYNVYFNPYSGKFLHREKTSDDFFLFIEDLHMHLLLPEAIGKQVVGIATIIFIIMLLSGIVLWWPKKKTDLKKRLKIKWDAKWRRVNYDWHNVTGFYVALIALTIALTGLTFSYEWMHKTMYFVGNMGNDYPEEKATVTVDTLLETSKSVIPVDIAYTTARKARPEDQMCFVWQQDHKSAIITGSYPESLDFDHQSNMFFHPATGELLKQQLYDQKSAGMQLQEMNYGLHTGQYFNLPGKIIAFIASLIAAALPVSGVVIWIGRNNKKSKTKIAA
ncbi:PepSY-associated TM helix domain-containing protein [Flavobacterium sp. AG291]|uniref:PepSY-associated TM helix domain-containing protein n=1 Tax=Flavobacterium sp. AG291 TaxID=2184000 RepID=UPI000E0B9421|nr:PepSY-associated TM helix domain-containing protein [Flavobacterium sp. AG291]RDI10273.1 putative iron-regulated membrane protein [Flavobacterium sp. AG291]